MSAQRVVIATLGWGGWYPRGVSRLIERFNAVSPGFEITAFVNTLPPRFYQANAQGFVVDGYDYIAYGAKPYVLDYAQKVQNADIAILLDASFYPIRRIHPLIEHIARNGYYLCRNGNTVGEWSSDRCLNAFELTRDRAMGIEEISSYCVGLNFAPDHGYCRDLLDLWCHASTPETICGAHENTGAGYTTGRNPGWVSDDPRVRGHRHDQVILSVLAHNLGMNKLTNRPRFTAYLGSESEETVLCNQGMG